MGASASITNSEHETTIREAKRHHGCKGCNASESVSVNHKGKGGCGCKGCDCDGCDCNGCGKCNGCNCDDCGKCDGCNCDNCGKCDGCNCDDCGKCDGCNCDNCGKCDGCNCDGCGGDGCGGNCGTCGGDASVKDRDIKEDKGCGCKSCDCDGCDCGRRDGSRSCTEREVRDLDRPCACKGCDACDDCGKCDGCNCDNCGKCDGCNCDDCGKCDGCNCDNCGKCDGCNCDDCGKCDGCNCDNCGKCDGCDGCGQGCNGCGDGCGGEGCGGNCGTCGGDASVQDRDIKEDKGCGCKSCDCDGCDCGRRDGSRSCTEREVRDIDRPCACKGCDCDGCDGCGKCDGCNGNCGNCGGDASVQDRDVTLSEHKGCGCKGCDCDGCGEGCGGNCGNCGGDASVKGRDVSVEGKQGCCNGCDCNGCGNCGGDASVKGRDVSVEGNQGCCNCNGCGCNGNANATAPSYHANVSANPNVDGEFKTRDVNLEGPDVHGDASFHANANVNGDFKTRDVNVQTRDANATGKCGQCDACDKIQTIRNIAQKYGASLLSKLGLNFSLDSWNQAHNAGTVEQNHTALEELGVDLKKLNTLPTNLERCAFICCNTYTKPSYSLGVGPMNDSITVATYLKSIGFTIYFVHNPKSTEFLKFFKYFIANTKTYLVVYYTGHGGSVDDKNGDESDGKDEALVFDDAFVLDDDLATAIATAGKPAQSKVCLFNDCCHSGSIYDLQNGMMGNVRMPENIMSLSAARDSETAKQTSIGGTDSGVFTFYFFKLLSENPNQTPITMQGQIGQYLQRFEQNYVVTSTSPAILNQTIFN